MNHTEVAGLPHILQSDSRLKGWVENMEFMAVPMGPITETVPAELEMKRLATDYSVTIFLDWLTTSLDFHAQQTEAQSLSNLVLLEWQSIQLVTCMSGSDLCGLCYMVLTAHIPLPDPA